MLLAASARGRRGLWRGVRPGGRGLPAGSEVSVTLRSAGLGALGTPGLPVHMGHSGVQMDPADSGRCMEDTSPS